MIDFLQISGDSLIKRGKNITNLFFLFLIIYICWVKQPRGVCNAYVTIFRPTGIDGVRNNLFKGLQPSFQSNWNYQRNNSFRLNSCIHCSSTPHSQEVVEVSQQELAGNRSLTETSNWLPPRIRDLKKKLSLQWIQSVQDFKQNPWQYLSIPVVAAVVGYVTNYIGVWMLFHPIEWKGLPIKRWPQQPFGILGWQGVVPAKRFIMSTKMVDVTINRLLSIKEVFQQLDLPILSSLFTKLIHPHLYSGLLPISLTNLYMKRVVEEIIGNIEKIIDLRQLVITKMTTDPRILGNFFQKVGQKELQFLVSSGTYFGFGLGVLQMIQWMLYPNPWTLPIGGAIVGYITNWIALKWIFEPLTPQSVGPFILQGLFLKRQREVTTEFVQYMTSQVLYSQELWRSILLTPENYQCFLSYIQANLPNLLFPRAKIEFIGAIIKDQLLQSSPLKAGKRAIGPRIHRYIDNTLQLKTLLTQRMNALTPKEFEQILHPIFQEDELTLIIAGGILGLLAGYGQMIWNNYQERKKTERKKEKKNQEEVSSISS